MKPPAQTEFSAAAGGSAKAHPAPRALVEAPQGRGFCHLEHFIHSRAELRGLPSLLRRKLRQQVRPVASDNAAYFVVDSFNVAKASISIRILSRSSGREGGHAGIRLQPTNRGARSRATEGAAGAA